MVVSAALYFAQLLGRYGYRGFRGAMRMFNTRDFALAVIFGAIIAALEPYNAYFGCILGVRQPFMY